MSWLAALLLILAAPLYNGTIQKVKARWQGRRGPGVWQPYRQLWKLWQKGNQRGEPGSWLFSLAPAVSLAVAIILAFSVPNWSGRPPLSNAIDLLALIYLLALDRFFTGIAGLDGGTAFGGLGSGRELTLAALLEPVVWLSLLPFLLATGGTSLWDMVRLPHSLGFLGPARLLSALALGTALIGEFGRLPVDNPDTHLELTMIHEAITLDYSGRDLAFIQTAAFIRQLGLTQLGLSLFLPQPGAGWLGILLGWGLAWSLSALAIASIESLSTKLRIGRLPGFLGSAAAVAALAIILRLGGRS